MLDRLLYLQLELAPNLTTHPMSKGPDLPDRGVRVQKDSVIADSMKRSLERDILAFLDRDAVRGKFQGEDLGESSFDGERLYSDFNEFRAALVEWLEGKIGLRSPAFSDGDVLDVFFNWEKLGKLMDEIDGVFFEHIEEVDGEELEEALEEAEDEKAKLAAIVEFFKAQIRGVEKNCPRLVKEREDQVEGLKDRLRRLSSSEPELVTIDGVPALNDTGMTRLAWDLSDKYTEHRESDDENGIIAVRVPVRLVEEAKEDEGVDEDDDPDACAISVRAGKERLIPVMFTGHENRANCTHYLIQATRYAIPRMGVRVRPIESS